MADVKISALPTASVVNDADIAVINQGGTTKTASKALIVAGLATTTQISGLATTSQLSGYATTGQITAFQNSAQVQSLASAQIAAITPASIGAFETSAIIGIENGGTGAFNANDALTNLGAIPTSQQAGGDLSGQLTAPNVAKLYGNAISQLPPSGGQVLRWSGAEWEPSNGNNGTVTSITVGSELMVDGIPGGTFTESGTIGLSGTGFPAGSYGSSAQVAAITFNGFGQITSASNEAITPAGIGAMSATQAAGGDLSGSLPNPTVAKIQGNAVSEAAPSNGQVLQWNGAAWVPGEIPSGGSGGGGQVFFFNYNTAADAPTTGLPTTPTIVKELGRTADTTGTSYTSGDLSTTGYDLVVHFVTDVLDPNITAIPAGLFDFNFWASSTGTTTNQTIVQLKVFKYDGTTATLLATSDDISIYDPTVTAQYIASVVIPQTTISASDRLYIQFLGKATQNNKTITLNFGATQPAHVHTTVPSVGGSGLVKVVDGVFQSPASLLVNADVATNAAIALSKVAMSQVSVLSGDGLTGGGDLSTSRTLALTTTGVSALSYGSSTQVAALTVDAYGRLTAASNQAISATGIGAQIALTSAAPLAIDKGGTGAISTQAAISNLGIGMRLVEAQTTANIVGTMATGPDPDTFTVTATGVFAADGYTPVLGDIIAFALQTTTTQNGFWEVTTVGAVGVQAVFTRPSWYTGIVKNSMYMARFGSAQNGWIQSFVGPLGVSDITVGTTNITMQRVNFRQSPATVGSNVFTGPQTLRANGSGAQNCPIIFQAGVALMGTPVANAVEWFGDQLYLTTAAGVRATNTTHVAIPATSTSAGLVGQIAVDNAGSWLYVCTATNVWKRVLLATF